MGVIKDLLLRIRGDSSQLDKETKKAQGTLGRFKNFVGGLAPVIAGAFAVRAVVNFGKKIVELAQGQERAEAKVTQAVKATGQAAGFTAEELKKEATALQELTTFGDEDILGNVTAQMLTFTNIAGDNFKKAQVAAMDLATLLDGDLKSASIQLGKALNDPVANLSALSRSGIQFSEAQKEQIKTLAESNRLSEAQAMILAEINKQYGGQAEAMEKLPSGKIKQMKNLWGDLSEMLGGGVNKAMGAVAEVLSKLIKRAIEGIPIIREKIRNVANGFIDLYNESESFRAVIGVIGATFKTVFGAIQLAIKQVGTGFQTVGKIVGAAFRGQFKEIPKIVADGFGQSIENIKGFGVKAAQDFGDAFKNSKKAYLEPIQETIKESVTVTPQQLQTATSTGEQLGAAVAKGLADKVKSKQVTGISTDITAPTAGLAKSSLPDYSGIAEGMAPVADATQKMFDAMSASALQFGEAVMQAGTTGEGGLKEFGKEVVKTAKKIISAQLAQGVASAVSKALVNVPFPFNIAAAGVAGGAAAALFNSIVPSFASGGMVDRPTLAMVGDAKDGRPEYIFNSTQMDKMMNMNVTGVLKGRDIWLSVDRENQFRKSNNGGL